MKPDYLEPNFIGFYPCTLSIVILAFETTLGDPPVNPQNNYRYSDKNKHYRYILPFSMGNVETPYNSWKSCNSTEENSHENAEKKILNLAQFIIHKQAVIPTKLGWNIQCGVQPILATT